MGLSVLMFGFLPNQTCYSSVVGVNSMELSGVPVLSLIHGICEKGGDMSPCDHRGRRGNRGRLHDSGGSYGSCLCQCPVCCCLRPITRSLFAVFFLACETARARGCAVHPRSSNGYVIFNLHWLIITYATFGCFTNRPSVFRIQGACTSSSSTLLPICQGMTSRCSKWSLG